MTAGAGGGGPAGIPGAVVDGVTAALSRDAGRRVRVESARGVGGGCIHHAVALETSAGPFFLKWNRGRAGDAFTTEARSLEALRRAAAAGEIQVPRVLGAADALADGDARGPEGAPGWLLLEYLPPSPAAPGHAEALGRGIAGVHRAGASAVPGPGRPAPDRAWGWPEENRIGSLPQPNPWTGSWPVFWREARLRLHLEALAEADVLEPRRDRWAEEVLEAVEPALAGASPDRPHLVHGDLWSGNVHPGPSGRPVLVDPACCLGHGEVDLAMARLFGGFADATFRAYEEVVEVPDGFEEVRLPLYQLYYLLVHVRLFGGGYLARSRRAAERVMAAVG